MKPAQPSLFPSSPLDLQKPGDIRRRRSSPTAELIRARAVPASGSPSPFPSASAAETERARDLTAALFVQLSAEGRNPFDPVNVGAHRDEMLASLERADPARDYAQLLLPGGSIK